MTVLIRYQEDGSITMRTPYNQAFVDDFKITIPARHRQWLPEEKLWKVSPKFAGDTEHLCKDWFGDVDVIFYQRHEPPPPPRGKNHAVGPYADLYLIESAPWPVVEVVYKALARLYHPDKGGDTETMQRINAAYTVIKERSPKR